MNGVLLSEIKALVAEQFGIDDDQVTPEADFRETLGADSLDLIELNVAVAHYLDADIVDGEMRKVCTVGDLVNFLEAHCRAFAKEQAADGITDTIGASYEKQK